MTKAPDQIHARVTFEERVCLITIDRPPANAIDMQLLAQIQGALEEAITSGAGAVVITGQGRFFVSGADIRLVSSLPEAEFRAFVRAVQSAFDDLEAFPLPTIAAINGAAVGGGLEMALACDFRFSSTSAILGLPEVKLGLLPGAGGTQRLSRIAGKGRALDLMYTGRTLKAEEALAIGIVEQVLDPESLLPFTLQHAKLLASGPREAMAAIKRCVLVGYREGIMAGLRAELEESVGLVKTPDAREGIDAFLAKRAPSFGREGGAS
jgi:enoyl-CoA hydratase/carnithine racemase